MSRRRGGVFGVLLTLLKITAIAIIGYFVISYFSDSSSSKSEYISVKGVFEQIDINNIDLSQLENKGSQTLNTFGSVAGELWGMCTSFVQSSFQDLIMQSPQRILNEGSAAEANAIPCGWPVSQSGVSSIGSYGLRLHPIKGRFITHKGVDLPCASGTPIYATADGVVESSVSGQATQGYGEMILIRHDGKYQSRYAHLSRRIVVRGQAVKRGQIIGYVGSTGGSTGPHLHYEVIKSGETTNPKRYLNLTLP